jgi:hypothetical protein
VIGNVSGFTVPSVECEEPSVKHCDSAVQVSG